MRASSIFCLAVLGGALTAQSPTLIGGGGGGGGTGGTSNTSSLAINATILQSTSYPTSISGKVYDLQGDKLFNVPWNGSVPLIYKGRTIVQFDPFLYNSIAYTPTPQIQSHFHNTSIIKVNYLPSGTTAGYITGLQVTQGPQNEIGSVPLVANKPALLKIFGCGLNFTSAQYSVVVTSFGQSFNYSLSGSVSNSVNDGAWDQDPIARYTSLVIPSGIVSPGMQISVTMVNAPPAPFGRTDLFPITQTATPAFVQLSSPVRRIRFVPITVNGVLPALFQDGVGWQRMVDRVRCLLPFSDINFAVYQAYAWEDLARLVPPWEQNDPVATWKAITYIIYHYVGGGNDPVVGMLDYNTYAGSFLGTVYSGITLGNTDGSSLPASTILGFGNGPETTGEILAHEFGHQSQRKHAPSISVNGQAADNPDIYYPYRTANSTSGMMFNYLTEYWGGISGEMAPSRGAVGTGSEIHGSHDVMSYGGYFAENGISDYTHSAIRQYWGSSPITSGFTATVAAPAQPDLPQELKDSLKIKNPTAAYEHVRKSLTVVQ